MPVRWMKCSPWPASAITRPRGAVDLLAGDARPTASKPACWALANDVVDLAFLVGRVADVDGARGVGAVAVHEPAEVQHDHVAVLDHPLPRLVVRVGPVGPGADDGEVDLRVAVVDEQAGEVGGDVCLPAAGEPHLQERLEARVRGRARGGQPFQLVGVLDRAQHRQRGGHRDVARARNRLLEAEQLQRPGRVGDRVGARAGRAARRRPRRGRCRRPTRSARSSPRSEHASASGRSRLGRIMAGSRSVWSDEHA